MQTQSEVRTDRPRTQRGHQAAAGWHVDTPRCPSAAETRSYAAVDDAELVVALAGETPDRQAWEELYRRYYRLVAGHIARRIHRAREVEDLVQDVFTRLPAEAATFDPTRTGSVRGWLCQVVAGHALTNYLRDDRGRHPMPLDPATMPPAPPTPIETSDEREAQPLSVGMVTALSRLTPTQREAAQVCYVEGHCQETAALLCGVGVETMKSRRRYARRALAAQLAELGAAVPERAHVDKKAAVLAAFTAVGDGDVPAALAWLRQRGTRVDPGYAYCVRKGSK